MWKEFGYTVSCKLPREDAFIEVWENFAPKFFKKAEIEAGKDKVAVIEKMIKSEQSLISDENICKLMCARKKQQHTVIIM